ncbi:MAG TPA: CDGSH iron-sulfur domain-containing protein [Thermoanaerobaculia bacterium]|jgi:CDGSH-type Zn-finger protein|nr:CDGSH iron-sulfur domain-containing protein [Thermoanaerobaculia bacterium]
MSDFKVTVSKNGPLRVEGENIQLLDPEGRPYGLGGRGLISLCRCGHSANKPFCDGSHNHHGFQDDPQARELPPRKPAS